MEAEAGDIRGGAANMPADQYALVPFDPHWPDAGRKTGSALDTVIYWSSFKEEPLHEKGKPDRE